MDASKVPGTVEVRSSLDLIVFEPKHVEFYRKSQTEVDSVHGNHVTHDLSSLEKC